LAVSVAVEDDAFVSQVEVTDDVVALKLNVVCRLKAVGGFRSTWATAPLM
jgi:hypothetical protein